MTTIETIKAASWVEVVHIDPTMETEAWTLLHSRLDKTWSLVDCASFTVMQHRGIREALTTDHNFEQAGFVQLLRVEMKATCRPCMMTPASVTLQDQPHQYQLYPR